jgi:hypothetical protein
MKEIRKRGRLTLKKRAFSGKNAAQVLYGGDSAMGDTHTPLAHMASGRRIPLSL